MRFGIFIVLIVIGLFTPLWLFLIASVCYAAWKPSYELIIAGVLIDSQFGLGVSSFPYLYTTSLALIVFFVELIKPHLAFYDI